VEELSAFTETFQVSESHMGMLYDRICPKCHWTTVRLSARRTVFDALAQFVFLHPFRCRSCRRRFYGFHIPNALRAVMLSPFRNSRWEEDKHIKRQRRVFSE